MTYDSVLGAVNALFGFGAALGAIVQGWIADSLGRKKAFAVAAVCSIIGGALTAGAAHIAMLIAIRLLQGFGLGMIICLVPLYISEVAPAHIRGRLSGLTVFSFGIGYVMYLSSRTALLPADPLQLSIYQHRNAARLQSGVGLETASGTCVCGTARVAGGPSLRPW